MEQAARKPFEIDKIFKTEKFDVEVSDLKPMNFKLAGQLVRKIGIVVFLAMILKFPLFGAVDYNKTIRPILSTYCFNCHGSDSKNRKGDLRLDLRESAIESKAIVPSDVDASELWVRIQSLDGEKQMPPPKTHKKLTASQKESLREWIREGANYQPHWAFTQPVKTEPMRGPDQDLRRSNNPIDAFIDARHRTLGLKSASQADPVSLIRRLSFDLNGIPPDESVVTRFIKENSQESYLKIVGEALASPKFGERMALWWLDLVRYGDSEGYYADRPIDVWAYRDYVINSFNHNKRFDRFTEEQLAGDYLSESEAEPLLGSAFNRLVLTTGEGGAQQKDYEARYMADRVRAVGTVWLGLTLECARCHDHKSDPISIRDFYAFGAFFADIDDRFMAYDRGIPLVPPSALVGLQKLEQRMLETKAAFLNGKVYIDNALRIWERDIIEGRKRVEESLLATATLTEKEKEELSETLEIIRTPDQERSEADRTKLRDFFLAKVSVSYRSEKEQMDAAEKEFFAEFDKTPRCLISNHSTRRQVRVFPRGNWMDESGEIVTPGIPRSLCSGDFSLPQRPTRLDLARWIVSPSNPLTARVFVNRLWAQFFGTGLSKDLQDFGIQGECPIYDDLLNWLAVEFVESGWNVKHMVELIVTSSAYKRASGRGVEPRDTDNRELTRQSRLRLPAELIRDNALHISGLLVNQIGGPSFKPYQPDHHWDILDVPRRTYVHDDETKQYRRGLYIWKQRSVLHPFLSAFDAPSGEFCTAERSRSNIPQQALNLLNDPTFIEAARAFASRILEARDATLEQRIEWAWRLALSRPPRSEETQQALKLYSSSLSAFSSNPADAISFLKIGYFVSRMTVKPEELAAFTNVTRMILNLDETITRP